MEMKKFVIAALLVTLVLLASCTTITPLCATSNAMGSKVGEANATYLFGYLPFGSCDCSIKTAAANGGITKISSVDLKQRIGFFTVTKTCIVTGE